MSAVDTIRTAAKQMREKALGVDRLDRDPEYAEVTGGPDAHWTPVFLESAILAHPSTVDDDPRVVRAVRAGAEHIAGMHPAVALAVADWLDHTATAYAQDWAAPMEAQDCLAVARAYLGT